MTTKDIIFVFLYLLITIVNLYAICNAFNYFTKISSKYLYHFFAGCCVGIFLHPCLNWLYRVFAVFIKH